MESNIFGGCAIVVENTLMSQIFNLMIMIMFIVVGANNIVCAIIIIYKLRQRRIQMAAAISVLANNDNQITSMLLSIALLYLICTTLPIMFTWFYAFYISKSSIGAFSGTSDIMIFVSQIGMLMKDLNHVGNFYVYCLTAKIFRKAFMDMISSCLQTCWKCRNAV